MGSNHSDIVRNWALDGHGIVLLSSWDVAPELKSGALVRVLPGYSEVANVWAATAARAAALPRRSLRSRKWRTREQCSARALPRHRAAEGLALRVGDGGVRGFVGNINQ
jgi:DNA-binding transcriptional LysR family regulator